MSNGLHPAPLCAAEAGGRSGKDRRASDRRAPRRTLDPLFAATLVNQIAPPEVVYAPGYQPKSALRPGIAFDLRA